MVSPKADVPDEEPKGTELENPVPIAGGRCGFGVATLPSLGTHAAKLSGCVVDAPLEDDCLVVFVSLDGGNCPSTGTKGAGAVGKGG